MSGSIGMLGRTLPGKLNAYKGVTYNITIPIITGVSRYSVPQSIGI